MSWSFIRFHAAPGNGRYKWRESNGEPTESGWFGLPAQANESAQQAADRSLEGRNDCLANAVASGYT